MKKLQLQNFGVVEMNTEEMTNVDGGAVSLKILVDLAFACMSSTGIDSYTWTHSGDTWIGDGCSMSAFD